MEFSRIGTQRAEDTTQRGRAEPIRDRTGLRERQRRRRPSDDDVETLKKIAPKHGLATPHEIWPLPTYREMLLVK